VVKSNAKSLDRTFAALADPTRRAMLARMARTGQRGISVGRLAEPFDMSLPAVSKHLRVLERAGLLRQERDGRVRRCTVDPKPIRAASQWIERYRRFWDDQLDALARFLEAESADAGHPKGGER
jgi:DNA-binding transcriptional ArsR family regulator